MKHLLKAVFSVILAVIMAVTALCAAAVSASAEGEETVVYKCKLKCDTQINGFDGRILYPNAKLSVKSITKSGVQAAEKNGTVLFNGSNANPGFEFTTAAVILTVEFNVIDSTYTPADIYADFDEFYTNAQARSGGNTPFICSDIVDDNVITNRYVDIDTPANSYDDTDHYFTEDSQSVDLDAIVSKDAEDTLLGIPGNRFRNLELLGVQYKNKKTNNEKPFRFVATAKTEILRDALDYGFIVLRTKNGYSKAREYITDVKIETVNSKYVFSCKETNNTVSGEYGTYNSDTSYKYVTCGVEDLADYAYAAKFYVTDKNGKTYYAVYEKSAGETYNNCVVAS